ncbi:sulfatase-like hydrolase/transferase [Luteolibacter sp. LG18]|uniref:sulfatase-like hydrolase/transferase n=1 Tax=Luteolibacter sp. LG18 TaxID=2819286 RepID=UPI002B29A3E2|nr:hypothetical protein llg_45650 [Luteolibacter sp. LG18]
MKTLLLAAVLALPGIAPAQINIAFHNSASVESAMAAGTAPTAQGTVVKPANETWNNVTRTSTTTFSFSGIALQSADGSTSEATLAGTSGYAGNNANGWAAKTKDSVMMESWFGLAGSESITVSNLPAAYASGFSVIVYGDSNDTAGRTMSYKIGTTTKTVVDNGTFSGTFTEGANFVTFTGLSGSSFTLTGNAATPRSAINGLVIVPGAVAQPPSIASFDTPRRYVQPGTPVTLSWQTTGTTTLEISPGIGTVSPGSGTQVVTPTATTTYKLTATNAQGTATKEVRVGVGPTRPNILVFLVDDMGWQDCSLPFLYTNGQPVKTSLNQLYRTPNLETLGAQGLRFTNACAHTVCSPSRVSLMTGMNAARHHVTNWTYPTYAKQTDIANATLDPPTGWRINGMDSSDVAMPGLLQDAGYRTIHTGKAHFGPMKRSDNATPNPSGDPMFLGFDVNIAGWGAGGPGSYASEQSYGTDPLWHVPGLESYYTPTQTHTHLTEALTQEIGKSIEESVQHGQPFFAYMSHYAIHAPYEVDARFSANYPGLSGTMLGHATLIEGMDKSLGDLLRKLDDLHVAENTLIVFLGDNGAETPSTSALPAPSAPLRGRKGTPYEGGMRVPLVAAWAKRDPANPFQAQIPIPANGHNDDIVSIDDLFPTLLATAGVTAPAPVDGHSLLPYLQGNASYHVPQEFVTHLPHSHNDSFFSTLRDGQWKLIHRYLTRSWEFYDLSTDPGETTNLATNPTPANAARLMRMARHLASELKRYGAQFPTEDATGNERPLLMPNLTTVDSDGDGIPDMQEDTNRNGLTDPGETDADKADSDGDGTPDGAEKKLGTNPLDPTSAFMATPSRQANGTLAIEWPSQPGTAYEIRSSLDMADWSTLVAADVPAAQGTRTRYELGAPDGARRFFRVSLK